LRTVAFPSFIFGGDCAQGGSMDIPVAESYQK
jgi:hypothetical protein